MGLIRVDQDVRGGKMLLNISEGLIRFGCLLKKGYSQVKDLCVAAKLLCI